MDVSELVGRVSVVDAIPPEAANVGFVSRAQWRALLSVLPRTGGDPRILFVQTPHGPAYLMQRRQIPVRP